MCGIAGYFGRPEASIAPHALLSAMVDAIGHRGPEHGQAGTQAPASQQPLQRRGSDLANRDRLTIGHRSFERRLADGQQAGRHAWTSTGMARTREAANSMARGIPSRR